MHTSTFLQKANPAWLFCQVLLLLLTFGTAFMASAQAPTLTATTVLVAANSNSNVTSYDAKNLSNNPDFNGANLGNIDITTGTIVLTGGTATTNETGTNTVSSVVLYYRVPAITSVFTGVALTQIGDGVVNADGSTTRTFSLSTANQNLLTNITATGTYNVDVYLQASYSDGTNSSLSVTDNNSGKNYIASFTVTGTPIVNTVWTGAFNDNWFDPRNWTSGVPTATNDATIRNLGNNSPYAYPNIFSDAVKNTTPAHTIEDSDGKTIVVPEDPGYNNTGTGNAMVRNLFMEGSSSIEKSVLRLIQGRLDVFGDFTDIYGSFVQRATSTISFKSSGNQTISGAPNGLVNVEIDGSASSIKTLTYNFKVLAGGSLKFINGILQTSSAPSTNYIELEGTTGTVVGGNYVPAAQLLGETETKYLRGYLRTSQVAAVGTKQDFSNIGIGLTFSGANEPGQVTVTRTTNDNNTENAFGNKAPSIRRVFQVQPSNPSTNNGGLNTKIEFNYLDNELVNLKTVNAGNTGSVDENKLALFVSDAGGNSYSQLGRDADVDVTNNLVTKTGVTTFGFFTLSEQQTPLPVELISFDAKRLGASALLAWATASEVSNFGFEVQVSVDGINFRRLTFVTSKAVNSSSTLQYTYLDEENGKYGTRYYRLRQLDQDGSDDFSPVRAVSFSAVNNQVATLSAYPNPYNGSDAVKLLLETNSVGTARLRVSDLLGREVANQTFTTVNGATEVALDQAAKLSMGTYMAQVTLPSGEVKTIRIQKR
jgi:hypothetical protein